MADQNPGNRPRNSGDDLGERIRQNVHDEINDRMDAHRQRWEAKMERRRLRWQSRAYRRRSPFGGIVIGAILAGIGVILLLQNLGIPFADNLWDFWPVILIVVGGSRLVSAWDTGGRIFGGIVMFVGGVFLLRNFGLLPGNIWNYFWPVMLIAIGLALLLRALEGNHAWDLWTDHRATPPNPGSASSAPPAAGGAGNSFREEVVFSGSKRRYETQDFEGGDALAIFGGIEIDLRKADTRRDQIVIEANAIFGGIEMRIPEHWRVVLRGTGIFGGFGDETAQIVGGEGRRPELIVTGSAVFGGVNVKN